MRAIKPYHQPWSMSPPSTWRCVRTIHSCLFLTTLSARTRQLWTRGYCLRSVWPRLCPALPSLWTLLSPKALRRAGFQSWHRSLSYHRCVSLRHAHRRSLRTISRLSGDAATLWPVLERYLRLPVPHLTSFLAQVVSVRDELLSVCMRALLARQRTLERRILQVFLAWLPTVDLHP